MILINFVDSFLQCNSPAVLLCYQGKLMPTFFCTCQSKPNHLLIIIFRKYPIAECRSIKRLYFYYHSVHCNHWQKSLVRLPIPCPAEVLKALHEAIMIYLLLLSTRPRIAFHNIFRAETSMQAHLLYIYCNDRTG